MKTLIGIRITGNQYKIYGNVLFHAIRDEFEYKITKKYIKGEIKHEND